MISIKNGKVFTTILVFMAAYAVNAANLRVSKLDGPYTKIMDAIKDAKPGDSVIIADAEVYEEQVTIDSTKNGIVLTSENPTSRTKPTIKWQDKAAVNPKSCADAKDEAKSSGFEKAGTYFDQNGAVRIFKARGVVIDGIIIDGGGAYVFQWAGVWSTDDQCRNGGCNGQPCPLFHGNAALAIWVAGDAVIRNCDLQNAYFGISVKDRNIRGVFAHPNPADIVRQNIVPLSGFGKTGNHLFEQNRIHNNSWGMFFESAWDRGSTLRYNLIFDNYHQTDKFTQDLLAMGADATSQPGGGLFFKDVPLSPVSIYNNTFWHNTMNLAAHWQAGASHLIFNNIFGPPKTLWNNITVNEIKNQTNQFAMEKYLVDRMKHNLFASQQEPPQTQTQRYTANEYDAELGKSIEVDTTITAPSRVVIMNQMDKVEIAGQEVVLTLPLSSGDKLVTHQAQFVIKPGALLLECNQKTFPADANNRWLEVNFKSTDPKSADFLKPDDSDSIMQKFIVDKGWPEGDIRDDDGSMADIGAIPMGSAPATNKILIQPIKPVVISGSTAIVNFNLYSIGGSITNPVVKYVRWVGDLPRDSTGWGNQVNEAHKPLILNFTMPAKIAKPSIPSTKVQLGLNTLTFDVTQAGEYAFLEMVIEGVGSNGKPVSTNVGFLPYRKLENTFSVKLFPPTGPMTAATELTQVQVGEPYRLQIIPQDVKGVALTFGEVKETELSMVSPYELLDPDGKKIVINSVPLGGLAIPVMFTKIPEQGWDVITVNGVYWAVQGETGRAIMGTSSQINIKPGLPAKVLFQSPPSNGLDIIYPGISYGVKLQVYDKYDNKVKTVTRVKLSSGNTAKGEVDGSSEVDTDTNGVANLKMKVTGGKEKDTIPIKGTLVTVTGAEDNAKLIVGKPKNRYYIFFGDTAMYNPAVKIENICTGTRVPVQIRVSTNGNDTITDVNNEFSIEFTSPQLAAFASESGDDTVKITKSKVTKGITKFYIQATEGAVTNGVITITDITGTPRINNNSRGGINFISCITSIKNAHYSANNGNGAVDQLDIYYAKALKSTEIPDSVEIYWPKSENRKMVLKANMKLDPQDSTHVVVSLPEPFPGGITTSASEDLGTSYWKNPNLTQTVTAGFKISDKVGPIIQKAWLIERLTPGNDTLIVAFSEFVQAGKVTGEALQITTKGGVVLNVLSTTPTTDNRLKIVVENKDETKAPKDGDSLKIYVDASGVSKIIDANGNNAHKDNRPVKLVIQEIAPSIDVAGYYDKNGDGTVDSVVLKFNKKVKLADQTYMIYLGANLKTDTIKSENAAYLLTDKGEIDSTKIALNISNKFKGDAAMKTSGDMNVTVESSRFSEVVKKRADDHAAPVIIDTVWLYQGKVSDDGNSKADDTLLVKFSEPLKSQPASMINSFVFTKGGSEYQLNLADARQTTIKNEVAYVFTVKGISGAGSVENDDRVMIKADGKTSQVIDANDNAQGNNPNRKALIRVKEQPVRLSTKVGPSPFVAGSNDGLSIFIQPYVSDPKKSINTSVKILIYDNLGNIVYTTNDVLKTKERRVFKWNGRSRNGRLVGIGTYLVIVKSFDNNTNVQDVYEHKIAAKRE